MHGMPRITNLPKPAALPALAPGNRLCTGAARPRVASQGSRTLTAAHGLASPPNDPERTESASRDGLPLSDALCRAAVLLLGPQVPRLCGLGSCRSVLTAEARKLLE